MTRKLLEKSSFYDILNEGQRTRRHNFPSIMYLRSAGVCTFLYSHQRRNKVSKRNDCQQKPSKIIPSLTILFPFFNPLPRRPRDEQIL